MKNIITIFLVISLFFNLLYFLKLKTTNSKLDDCNYSYHKNEELLVKIADSYIIQYEFEGRKIETESSIIDTLLQLTGKGPKLFLSFNQQSCEGCVNLALNELKKIGDNIGNNNIIIVTNFENNKDAKYLGARFDEKIRVINFKSRDICFIREKYPDLPPSFFILDDNLKVNLFFIYTIESPTLNERYFKEVRRYFSGS